MVNDFNYVIVTCSDLEIYRSESCKDATSKFTLAYNRSPTALDNYGYTVGESAFMLLYD